jgi:hypothetical protein
MRYVVHVVCRAQSHEPRVAITGHLRNEDGETTSGVSLLIDEIPVEARDVWGSSVRPPNADAIEQYMQKGRARNEFECELCGLRVELRDETAAQLMDGLIKTAAWRERTPPVEEGEVSSVVRVSSIGLEALAASL